MGILAASSFDSFFQLLGVLIIFVFVLAVTYFTTKWMGGFQKTHLKNKNLGIVEVLPIGNGKMICIVSAGKKYLVVSVGKEEINYLAELSEDDFTDLSFLSEKNGNNAMNFQDILNKWKDKIPSK